MTDLLARDQKTLWHPYSQHGLNEQILAVESAEGATLRLVDGREVIDGISSWWVNLHGHGQPEIARAIHDQARRMEHVLFAGFTHEPAVTLAELLTGALQRGGRDFTRVFFSDNGSTAVEVALKMAFQFALHRGFKRRTKFLALRGSYHGDTLGAMAVGDPDGYHALFRPLLPKVDFISPDDRGLAELRAFLEQECSGYAAFIFEPLLQGAGGMRLISRTFLEEAARLCRERDVLLIADEVFTGFYRTGRAFALEHTRIEPDLVCLSKGITGGFLPLAATVCTDRIYEAFLSRDTRQAFLHGHSYTANPIACAAAVASWRLLEDPACQARIHGICTRTQERIARLQTNPAARDARCLGTVGAITLPKAGDYFSPGRERITLDALRQGVLLRPMGPVLYTVPPYCVTIAEVDRIYDVIESIAESIAEPRD